MIASVTDIEILSAQIRLANSEGLFAEPASAAPLALLFRLVRDGKIDKGSTAVVVLTGSGLKDPDAALKNVEPPIELDGDARTLAKVLKL
jgi:threonine synthase